MALSVFSTLYRMHQEIKIMKKQGYGRIVNNASGSGLVATPGCSVYGTAKFGVVGLTKTVALEYVREGITVNAIAPGATRTEMIDAMAEIDPVAAAIFDADVPIGRMAKPYEQADVVSFLMRKEAGMINGIVLPVDSGFVAGVYVEVPEE